MPYNLFEDVDGTRCPICQAAGGHCDPRQHRRAPGPASTVQVKLDVLITVNPIEYQPVEFKALVYCAGDWITPGEAVAAGIDPATGYPNGYTPPQEAHPVITPTEHKAIHPAEDKAIPAPEQVDKPAKIPVENVPGVRHAKVAFAKPIDVKMNDANTDT